MGILSVANICLIHFLWYPNLLSAIKFGAGCDAVADIFS